jgi:hypothetical protein
MTPSEVYTLVRNQITETSPDFWGETELYTLIWNAEKILAAELGCVESFSTLSTAASTREYTRPVAAQRISRITYDSTKLKKITFTDIDKIEGDTETSGDPEYYYEYGAYVGLVPTPIEIKTLKFYYNQIPTQLTSSSTAFSIPPEYAHYLADYVLSLMYIKDQQTGESDRHKAQWEKNLQQAKDQWGSRRAMDNYPITRDDEGYPFSDLGLI